MVTITLVDESNRLVTYISADALGIDSMVAELTEGIIDRFAGVVNETLTAREN